MPSPVVEFPEGVARERKRAELVGKIPKSYSAALHLLATCGSGLAVLIVAIWQIDHVAPLEWLIVPVMFLLANSAEWRAHKGLLHKRVVPAHILYDRHTPEHHVIFRYDDLSIRDTRELKLVLIPAFGVAMIVIATAPFALAAAWLLSPDAGWLVLVCGAMYVVIYELAHCAYHLPPTHPIGRLKIVQWSREHHRRHHHPRLMKKWNFNVVIPFWDWVVGTIAPQHVLDEAVGADRARHAEERPSEEAHPAPAE